MHENTTGRERVAQMRYPPRRWRCPCGAEHSRGHYGSIGVHRCLSCGYAGTGGVMLDPEGAGRP